MITALHISGVHSQLTDEMRSYVTRKIGGLDRFIPRRARQSVQAEVKLKENKSRDKQTHECEVILKLPGQTITVHRKSTAVLAAIDEVENNLKHQLKRYKDTHGSSRFYRHTLARFRRKEISNTEQFAEY